MKTETCWSGIRAPPRRRSTASLAGSTPRREPPELLADAPKRCPRPATRLPAGALYLRRTDVELLRPVRNRRKITAAHVWVHAPPPRAQAVGRAAEREVDVPGRSLGLARCFKCRICQHAHFANICQNFLWQLCCIGTNFCNQL